MVIGRIAGFKWTLRNAYAPNEDCPNFFKELAHLVADHGESFLIGGDLNCVLNNKIDKLPSSTKPQSRISKSLMTVVTELGLIDAWCHLHPKERDFTFMSQVHGSYSRLDHFLVSKKDTYWIKNCVIEPITISAHSPVQMTLDLGLEPCMKYWRINVSLLTDWHYWQTETKRLENEHKQSWKQEVFNKLKENRAKLDEILT